MQKPDFTIEDLLQELALHEKEGATVTQLAMACGMSRQWVLKKLHSLIAEGRAQFAGYVCTSSIDGRKHWAPVYSVCTRTE